MLKYWMRFKGGGGGDVNHSIKKGGDMNLEKIYVCARDKLINR